MAVARMDRFFIRAEIEAEIPESPCRARFIRSARSSQSATCRWSALPARRHGTQAFRAHRLAVDRAKGASRFGSAEHWTGRSVVRIGWEDAPLPPGRERLATLAKVSGASSGLRPEYPKSGVPGPLARRFVSSGRRSRSRRRPPTWTANRRQPGGYQPAAADREGAGLP